MKKLDALGGTYPKTPREFKPTYDPEVVDWLCKQPPVPTREQLRAQDREAALKKHVEEQIRKRADKLMEDTNYAEALAAQCTN